LDSAETILLAQQDEITACAVESLIQIMMQ